MASAAVQGSGAWLVASSEDWMPGLRMRNAQAVGMSHVPEVSEVPVVPSLLRSGRVSERSAASVLSSILF